MRKFDLICLYYASTLNDKSVVKIKQRLQKDFEVAKHEKHFLVGKTTVRRKKKKEAKVNTKRNANLRMNNIILYYNAIKKNPDILSILDEFDIKEISKFDSMESFLYNY